MKKIIEHRLKGQPMILLAMYSVCMEMFLP